MMLKSCIHESSWILQFIIIIISADMPFELYKVGILFDRILGKRIYVRNKSIEAFQKILDLS